MNSEDNQPFLYLGKLDTLPPFRSGDGLYKYGEVVEGKFHGINYARAFISHIPALQAIVPDPWFNMISHTHMTVNRRVPPHTDSGICTAVNIYYNTCNCRTQFYEINNAEDSFQLDNQTNGRIYNEAALTPTHSFTAAPGEVWLLDVTQVHSVEPESSAPIFRNALSLHTTVPFGIIKERLKGEKSYQK